MINLVKEKEARAVKLSLEKLDKRIEEDNIDASKKMRVVFVIDKSYSMYDAGFYENGTIKTLLRRILPIGIRIDSDESIEIMLFDHELERYPSMNMSNFFEYYGNYMNFLNYGGTDYSKPFELIGRTATDDESVFCIVLTDGDTGNQSAVEQAVKRASYQNIFFKILALGQAEFKFLKRIDTLDGRYVDNVDVEYIDSVDEKSLSDEDLYKKIFSGLEKWKRDYKKPETIPAGVEWMYSEQVLSRSLWNHSKAVPEAVPEAVSTPKKGFFRRLFGG